MLLRMCRLKAFVIPRPRGFVLCGFVVRVMCRSDRNIVVSCSPLTSASSSLPLPPHNIVPRTTSAS